MGVFNFLYTLAFILAPRLSLPVASPFLIIQFLPLLLLQYHLQHPVFPLLNSKQDQIPSPSIKTPNLLSPTMSGALGLESYHSVAGRSTESERFIPKGVGIITATHRYAEGRRYWLGIEPLHMLKKRKVFVNYTYRYRYEVKE